MKKMIVAIAALMAVSCSPVVYEIAVDVRKPSHYDIDLKGCPPSVVFISGREPMDSILTSRMAVGVAETIEKELSLEEGSIPVYAYFHDEVNVSNPDDVAFLLTTSGSDRVIVLDSLRTEDFSVSDPGERVFYETDFYYRTVVTQPFRVGFKIFCMDSLTAGIHSPEVSSVVADNLKWTLLAPEPIEKTKAVSRAVSSAPKTYSEMGQEIGSVLFPQWEEQNRMIIAYEESNSWYAAYTHARSFHWDEAMKIWLKFVEGANPRKVAFAAYNLAVACELQEQFDLAVEWLKLSESRYPFAEIAGERANIERALNQK